MEGLMVGWNTNTKDLAKAVAEIETALPGFWWLVGQCSMYGAHAACAVDGKGCQADLLKGVKAGDPLDRGFGCETRGGSPSEALRDVTQQALKYLRNKQMRGLMVGWNTDTKDFAKAVAEFEAALPGFWWSVGQCSVGAHASCAVDGKGCQAELLKAVKAGDTLHSGFHCDTRGGSPSEALRDVMRQALEFLRPSRCAAKGVSRRRRRDV
jgi:hypothetical protein